MTKEEKRAYARAYYRLNKEKLLDYSKKYRKLHREELNEYSRNWYKNNIDSMREYHRIYERKRYMKNKKDVVYKNKYFILSESERREFHSFVDIAVFLGIGLKRVYRAYHQGLEIKGYVIDDIAQ